MVRTRVAPILAAFFLSLAAVACSPKVTDLGPNGGGNPTPTPVDGTTPTWFKNVQPIMMENCSACHVSSGAAFALDTYAAAKPYAGLIRAATSDRRMPPWPPDQNCQEFKGQRVLTAGQKDVIARWVEAGAPEGNPADAAPFNPPAVISLGTPDKSLDPGGDYTFDPAANQDLYWCFRLNPGIAAATDFVAADVIPGNKEIVHHVIVFREANGQANPIDATGFQCDGAPGEFLFAWVPGSQPLTFPVGVGMQLQPNDRLLMQIHYSRVTGAASQVDRTKALLYFAKEPITERARVSWLGTPSINIPANSQATATGTCTVPANAGPVKLLMTAPHMHTMATKFNSTIVRAGGVEQCMIDIPRWEFGWQGGYEFPDPVTLNPGDSIVSTCTWNNTTNQDIGFGEGTGDEMCFNFVYVINDGSFPRYCFPGGALFDLFANGGLGN